MTHAVGTNPPGTDAGTRKKTSRVNREVFVGGQSRDRTDDLPLFRRTLVPTELPGQTVSVDTETLATLTGLEPATSAVTGRRANQLRHRALFNCAGRPPPLPSFVQAYPPYGIRTRATALKGRRPRPLDEGGRSRFSAGSSHSL